MPRDKHSSSSHLASDIPSAAAPRAGHYPTASVVEITSKYLTPDYSNPWRSPEQFSCTGSGVIIHHEGQSYILTNAHVAEDSIFLQVRLANDRRKKYEAKRVCISYQSDLALLEVTDPEFNRIAAPAELGEMVSLEQKVMTAGFPMGGSELSVSKGVVSRIEVGTYSESGLEMLQVQVDAAMNPGNSGGPVFSGDKVVGLAFQQTRGRSGMSYMIPVPIMEHFLREAFSGRPYRGFPVIPLDTEKLENSTEREYYQLGTKTGVLVTAIDKLCDAHNKLQIGDILLAIDGLPISNEGTIDIPGIGNCIDFVHAMHEKFIGDKVKFKVLRKNLLTELSEELTISVILDCVPFDTKRVPATEHDKMPTYYIHSGICFTTLTRNYLDGSGADLEEVRVFEEGCPLADVPKKTPDEQIIVVNHIFPCAATQGYDQHFNAIVKEINGVPINNIRDVIRALESNMGRSHNIGLSSKSRIVIPNMSAEDQLQLLRRSRVYADRSEDLQPRPAVGFGAGAGAARAGAGYGFGTGAGFRSVTGYASAAGYAVGGGAGAAASSRGALGFEVQPGSRPESGFGAPFSARSVHGVGAVSSSRAVAGSGSGAASISRAGAGSRAIDEYALPAAASAAASAAAFPPAPTVGAKRARSKLTPTEGQQGLDLSRSGEAIRATSGGAVEGASIAGWGGAAPSSKAARRVDEADSAAARHAGTGRGAYDSDDDISIEELRRRAQAAKTQAGTVSPRFFHQAQEPQGRDDIGGSLGVKGRGGR